jgi:colicin import membrane protein
MVDEAKEKAEQQEQAEAEAKAEEEKKAKDADYWRQQAQQNDANARRERQAREEQVKAASDTKAQLDQTTQKLQQLEQKLESKTEYQQMDKEAVDPAVASNIEVLQKQIEGLSEKLGAQQAKITQYEQLETQREQDRQYEQAVENICKPLDEKYGAKFRSEARAMADKSVEDGESKKPQTTLEAYLLHEKFYRKLSEKPKKKKKDAPPTDKGKGTVVVGTDREKQGTLDEVLSEMKARATT